MTARLELEGITKTFPGVIANADISFRVAPGEIHALLGENGAGKSTLVKLIYGVLQPDRGSILWEGRETVIADPKAARALGIGMVFQHFSLFEAMTVLENIALGIDARSERKALARGSVEVSRAYGLPLDPRALSTSSRSASGSGSRSCAACCRSPRLLIMDEPTSVLTPQEVERLFETLRQLAAEGCSILYISHKLEEIQALCDTATILRGGRVVAHAIPARDHAQHGAADGRRRAARRRPGRPTARASGKVRLWCDGLSLPAETSSAPSLADIRSRGRMAARSSASPGLPATARTSCWRRFSGERTGPARRCRIAGWPAGRRLDPACAGAPGTRVVPEERNGHGAVRDMLAGRQRGAHRPWAVALVQRGHGQTGRRQRPSPASIVQRFRRARRRRRCRGAPASPAATCRNSSSAARSCRTPACWWSAQPTWGVDAGAAAAIHKALVDAGDRRRRRPDHLRRIWTSCWR